MKKIIAITACPTGIAHTFMAAKALENAGKKLNYEIKVETQGATGIKNKITSLDIEEADAIIFAVETKVREEERFKDKKIHKISVKEAIKNAEKAINDALGE
ncbi:MAG: PTS fructose transporter subunit IIB [Sebaldella sp.]|nr:PTS fructose transporter subunit IIB [Sebaldella sp.]